MSRTKRLTVKVPASTANLGSGFDSVGIAFQLYTELQLKPSDQLDFIWKEKNGEIVPFPFSSQENLILRAMKKVCGYLGHEVPSVQVTVYSDIPASRGLGSSASAYVAGLCAMNSWFDGGLTPEQLLWFAAEEEGHADNVGAALFGGVFTGAIDWNRGRVYHTSLSFPEKWSWLAAIPSYSLSTSSARKLLPKTYERNDVIYNLSRYGLLISSITLGNEAGVREGLKDRLHQPYRQALIPGFSELEESMEGLGALGLVISGAGPTVLGLFGQEAPLEIASEQMKYYLTLPAHQVSVNHLKVDQCGIQITKLEN